MTDQTATALPPVVDQESWQAALDELRVREKAATKWLDSPDVARLHGPR